MSGSHVNLNKVDSHGKMSFMQKKWHRLYSVNLLISVTENVGLTPNVPPTTTTTDEHMDANATIQDNGAPTRPPATRIAR